MLRLRQADASARCRDAREGASRGADVCRGRGDASRNVAGGLPARPVRRRLGHGRDGLRRLDSRAPELAAQRGAGLEVVPSDAWVEDGETVLLLIRVGVLNAVAPCRVVYVVEEPGRFSFAYGTLPGHPEQGEVAFTHPFDAAETVTFQVRVVLASGRSSRAARRAPRATASAARDPRLPDGATGSGALTESAAEGENETPRSFGCQCASSR